MGAPNQSTVDLPLPLFGGLVSLYDPQTLPSGASPFNQDVIFPPGAVATRPGLLNFFNTLAGNPTIRFVKTYTQAHDNNPVWALDGAGNIYIESSPANITPIGATNPNSFARSVTAFGKEYMAFGDGNYGLGLPMQWDGTNLDRVSQVGPGAPPSPSSSLPSVNIAGAPNGLQPISMACSVYGYPAISQAVVNLNGVGVPAGLQPGDTVTLSGTADYNGQFTVSSVYSTYFVVSMATGAVAVEAGNVVMDIVTVTTTTAYMPSVGSTVDIAGAGVAGYDGTWPVVSMASSTVFNVRVTNGDTLANSGGGSIATTNSGNVAQGTRYISVAFITRQGYFTRPANPVTYTVNDSTHSISVGQIPTGPKNVVARVLLITPAGASIGGRYYIIPSFYIYDNTTTEKVVNFTDSDLQTGTDATNLFNLVELGECASVIAYSDRLFWAGERNKIDNFINLTFDGGWTLGSGASGSDVPLGWSQVSPTNSAGGSRDQVNVVWGDAYRITGDGVSGVRGHIQQPCYQDYLGVRILQDYVPYSLRVKLRQSGGITQGNIGIQLYSPSQGNLGIIFSTQAIFLSGTYTEFIAQLTGPAGIAIPGDAVLQVYMSLSVDNGKFVDIDCLEIFPTNQPYLSGQVRVSYALGNNPIASPESYDSVTGTMIPGENYGEIVKTFFRLLDNKLYFVKERSMYSTQDDGQNEPAFWTITTVSDVVGTPSVNGVDSAEGWAVIADHTGAYIFDGATPIKFSQEVQPDWDKINYGYDHTTYVCIDRQNKRIHIGRPIGASQYPNQELVCDYSQLNASSDIVDHPQAYYSTFAPGKLIAPGKARKWTVWNISAYSANICIRNDGTWQLFRGNAAGTGKIYDQSITQYSDDGVAINSQYQTYFFPELDQEQMLQLGAHEKHVEYITGYMYGSGSVSIILEGPQGQRAIDLQTIVLQANAPWDDELNANWEGIRFSLLFGTNAVGDHFTMSKLCPSVSRSLKNVRGVN